MPRCSNCEYTIPWLWRQWELVCPNCGYRNPSARSLVYALALTIVGIILHVLIWFVYGSVINIWDIISVGMLGSLAILLTMQIMILRRRRGGLVLSAPR